VRLGILERVVRRAQVGIEVGLASAELLDSFFELVNPLSKLERSSTRESSIALKPFVARHSTHLFDFTVRGDEIRVLVIVVPLDVFERLLESIVRLILYRLKFGHPVIGVRQLVLPLKQHFAEIFDVLFLALECLESSRISPRPSVKKKQASRGAPTHISDLVDLRTSLEHLVPPLGLHLT
jgi:hypothetical protein